MQDPQLGRPLRQVACARDNAGWTEGELDELERGYIDRERHAHLEGVETETETETLGRLNDNDGGGGGAKESGAAGEEKGGGGGGEEEKLSLRERDARRGRVVDVVLSDMSEPWDQTAGFHKKSLSDPYFRLMNTSGIAFKDHAGSMVGGASLRGRCQARC